MPPDPASDPATDADFDAMDQMLGVPEAETPAEPAPAEIPAEVPAEEPEQPEDSGEKLLAGKYKTPEDLERAYQELQSLEGRRSQELGELRKLVEERLPEPGEEELQINQPMVDWFDEQTETNPQAAAVWALQNDPSGALYDRAMNNWYEIPGGARQAAAFERSLDMQRVEAQLAEQTQPLKAQAEQQLVSAAWSQASGEIPDLAQFAEQILEEAKESPELLRGATTLEAKTKAIHKLYKMVKGGQATSLESATAENSAAEKEAARAAKLSGTAASTSKVVTPEQKSEGEQWLEDMEFDKYAKHYS